MHNTSHKIIIGDSRLMKSFEDGSVHLIVTSPPYWQLKDYGKEEQIGYDQTYEEYINHLNLVWARCFEVLHPGCKMIVNVGDQFARSVYYGRYKIIPIRTEIIKFAETIGFDYMGAIIWQKRTTMNTTGGAVIMGSYPYPRNGIVEIDYEFNLIFKKPGKAPKPTKEQKEASEMTKEEWKNYFSGHWNFAGAKQGKHLAAFPEELPRRFIKMYSFVGETVLDPFLGSGVTSLAAKNLGRSSIGYEINDDYLELVKENLGVRDGSIFGEEIAFEREESVEADFDERIKSLPYFYRADGALERLVDPKEMNFGSKISKEA